MESVHPHEVSDDAKVLARGARIDREDMEAWADGRHWFDGTPDTRRLFLFEAYYASFLLSGEPFTHSYPEVLVIGGGRFLMDPETEIGTSILDPISVGAALEFIRSLSKEEMVRKHGNLVFQQIGGQDSEAARAVLADALAVFDRLETFYETAVSNGCAVISVLAYP
jgi:hypothetical protein